MTNAKALFLFCGITLIVFSIEMRSVNAGEIPLPFLKKDYEECVKKGQSDQEAISIRILPMCC